MKKNTILICLFLLVIICQVFGDVSAKDIESFEIQAILPESNVNSGSSYGQLIIRDLYTDSQNMVTSGNEINIGRGANLFSAASNKKTDLFIVEYTTNSKSPVELKIEVSPFKSSDGQQQTIPMYLGYEAGYLFENSDVITELNVPAHEGGNRNTEGERFVIEMNGIPIYNSSDSDKKYSESGDFNDGNLVGADLDSSFKFKYQEYSYDWGLIWERYSWDDIGSGKISEGLVTNYVKYSISLNNNVKTGKFKMDIKVTATQE